MAFCSTITRTVIDTPTRYHSNNFRSRLDVTVPNVCHVDGTVMDSIDVYCRLPPTFRLL